MEHLLHLKQAFVQYFNPFVSVESEQNRLSCKLEIKTMIKTTKRNQSAFDVKIQMKNFHSF